jgi:tRNA (cytosine38-C5)-methyltransferase
MDTSSCICHHSGSDLLVPPKVISKPVSIAFDVVVKHSKSTCCFTKAYSRMVEGTGSIILMDSSLNETVERLNSKRLISTISQGNEGVEMHPEYQQMQNWTGRLRYFCPFEISLLHGFPLNYTFPQSIHKQKAYQLLGNSLSAHVVAFLLHILYSPQSWDKANEDL